MARQCVLDGARYPAVPPLGIRSSTSSTRFSNKDHIGYVRPYLQLRLPRPRTSPAVHAQIVDCDADYIMLGIQSPEARCEETLAGHGNVPKDDVPHHACCWSRE